MSAEAILKDWKQKRFKPVYWFEGEESYYIDKLVDYAEHRILSEEEAGFNLTVFYGRDAAWPDVLNACKRYPMFSERQVVLLKEAQHMKEIDKLEAYIAHPLPSTIFIVAHKEKKVDGRSKLAKLLKDKTVLLSTKKIYDDKLPEWTLSMVKDKGLEISQKAVLLLVDHIGNDLSRLENEIEKIRVNLKDRKKISEDDVENYVGISKEFNVFELQSAIVHRDLAKAIRIIQYFDANPKAAPIQLVLPTLYSFFAKVYAMMGLPSRDQSAMKEVGLFWNSANDAKLAERNYGMTGIEKAILLLHEYNLKSIGIGNVATAPGSLMKEMVYRLIA